MNGRELKLTAALYASFPGVVEHVRQWGELPSSIQIGGAAIGLKILIRERGTDLKLSDNERCVYEAMLRGGRLPGGRVVLVDHSLTATSASAGSDEVTVSERDNG